MLFDAVPTAVATLLALLPIVNPIGGAPFFFSLTAGDPQAPSAGAP